MDREAWGSAVHRVTQSLTRTSNRTEESIAQTSMDLHDVKTKRLVLNYLTVFAFEVWYNPTCRKDICPLSPRDLAVGEVWGQGALKCFEKKSWSPQRDFALGVSPRDLLPQHTHVSNRLPLNPCLPGTSECDFTWRQFLFYLWLHWVFISLHGLSWIAVSSGSSSLQGTNFSLWWLLSSWSKGSRHAGFSSGHIVWARNIHTRLCCDQTSFLRSAFWMGHNPTYLD